MVSSLPSFLFIDAERLLTSAKVAAGIEMCLDVICADHRSQVADQAARQSAVLPLGGGGVARANVRAPAITPTAGRRPRSRNRLSSSPAHCGGGSRTDQGAWKI